MQVKFEVKVNTSIPKMIGSTPRYLHNIQHGASSTNSPVVNFDHFNGLPSEIILEPHLISTRHNKTLHDSTALKPHLLAVVQGKTVSLKDRDTSKQKFAKQKWTLQNQSHSASLRKILEFSTGVSENTGFLPWEKNYFERKNYAINEKIGRKLLDTFGESLLHVNRLYNREFGFESRRVPSHMAHLIDKNIMAKVQER